MTQETVNVMLLVCMFITMSFSMLTFGMVHIVGLSLDHVRERLGLNPKKKESSNGSGQ